MATAAYLPTHPTPNNGMSALHASVLVLNRQYMAIHVIDVRRAFTLLLRELAEVIHIEDGQYANYDFDSWRDLSALRAQFPEDMEPDPHADWVRSINFQIQAPRILRLLHYDRVPRQRVRLNRRNLFARDGGKCQYCNKTFPTSELSIDHVVPSCRGGETTWENVVCACVRCNVRKGGRTPDEAGMKLAKKPVRPKRSPLLAIKLGNPKYVSWRTFVDAAYWSVDLR
ncbi:HNH endonuclease [Botrimarina mediterranea]|uniref:HNH endonuclease n=1 Tax=Botrimarina mediterranea TaxID=2528022 RepID=A0A518KC34_9BACT|nr:HNH endonuclease [Botrimarina mediterranea]QDV75338.1 HNH endonuclease [Botrimarina mediterranea]QDV80007.1 HNH endonuclease [Planctomycetes bacterium K2D]